MIINKLKHLSISVVLIITLIDVSYSQINLVQNPGFEILSQNPTSGSQINYAIGWGTFINGGGSSPDLLSEFCTYPQLCGVPSHGPGFQYPKSGNNYAGIIALWSANPNIGREYIQSKLSQNLKAGEEYCLKFFCNLSDFSSAYISSIGAYLDDGSISTTSPYGLPLVIPQVYSQQALNDTVLWLKIEESLTAIGFEEYISIGNFFSDSNSGMGIIDTLPILMSYYYIDDVSIIPTNLPAYAGNDTLIHPGDSVFIGRQPEIGLDEDCIWFVNGVPIDTVAGLWVQPDSTTTYVLEQTICGNVKWDTVTVSVYGTGIGEATNGLARWLRIYPNPATTQLTIESPVTNATLSISNLLGQELIRQEVTEKQFNVDVSGLGKGLYFVKLYCENGIVVKKFLKE